jgi:AraC-like DNA-binding protein
MEVTRTTLMDGTSLHIGWFEARPESDACGDVEQQNLNAVVLPLSGVFARHDAPGRQVIGTPSHAVFFTAGAPYRLSFPGAIGDRALTLRFGEAVAPDHLQRRGGGAAMATHGLLPARTMIRRNLLRARLATGTADRFEGEALGLDLLHLALDAMRTEDVPRQPAAQTRRRRAVERVKEAVAVDPARKWTVAALARIAHLSPFHLCHVFRDQVGTSLYDYVLHERLAQTLDAVVDGSGDLTTVALDAGFSSHSHFTARFRGFFGCTPAALRRDASTGRLVNLRKIMTAERQRPALD